MNWKKLPFPIKTGILIFPIVIILSVLIALVGLIFGKEISFLL